MSASRRVALALLAGIVPLLACAVSSGGASSPSGSNRITRSRDSGLLGSSLLGPHERDAYGPGVHSDATGRPFEWRTREGERVLLEDVEPNAYGPGVGMDEYGRPVHADPL